MFCLVCITYHKIQWSYLYICDIQVNPSAFPCFTFVTFSTAQSSQKQNLQRLCNSWLGQINTTSVSLCQSRIRYLLISGKRYILQTAHVVNRIGQMNKLNTSSICYCLYAENWETVIKMQRRRSMVVYVLMSWPCRDVAFHTPIIIMFALPALCATPTQVLVAFRKVDGHTDKNKTETTKFTTKKKTTDRKLTPSCTTAAGNFPLCQLSMNSPSKFSSRNVNKGAPPHWQHV